MATSIHQPHDKLVAQVLSDPSEMEEFLRAHLPNKLIAQIDWPSLKLLQTSFIDEEFQKRESDILYEVRHHESDDPAYLYLLFEHQSSPDKWMRLRLIHYMYCIWMKSFEDTLNQKLLRPILPVVFYQGESSWTYPTSFMDLFPKYATEWGIVPQFTHFLIDQSGIEPTDVQGGLKARVMQLLMLAAFHEPIEETLKLAAELLPQLPETGGSNFIRVFVVYLLATQDQKTAQEFVQTVREWDTNIGDDIMSYAEELILEGETRGKIEGKIEGEIKGEIKGKVETIQGLVKAGVGWSTVAEATNIDEAEFENLKKRLAEMEKEDNALPPSESSTSGAVLH